MGKQQKLIGSLQRALDILNLFTRQTDELGVTEIARALDLPKSTAAGLISTLEHYHYLDQHPVTRKYRLGHKLVERAAVYLDQFDLRRVAHPILEELRDMANESVNLAIRDDGYVTYIERLHGDNLLGMRSEIGKRERVHSTALGKAMLSKLPAEALRDFVSGYTFIPLTENTITNPDVFIQEVEATGERGFAVDDEENEEGGRCVAAAVFNHKGEAVAAISLSAPIQRFPIEKLDDYGSLVKEAAAAISRQMGASPEEAEQD